ncbi:MAG: family 78 glycoside hydrolase catalytic domain [Prevotella sp.]|nr:family 78 glycoside hydrolase catalytic domain [Prevotella sp.]
MGIAVALVANAKLQVIQQRCNHQTSETAIVERNAVVGWQMTSDITEDIQTAYQIVVKERVTGKQVYDSKKTLSQESQMIALPQLPHNNYGYTWTVRVWGRDDKVSDWSAGQQIRIAPASLDAQWVGAITKHDAHLPEGRFANTQYKKDDFKALWADVDTLSQKSIIVSKEIAPDKKKIADAIVYVSGMGHYELTLNGKKVGDAEFAPLWSEYDKTIYYNVYDVTQRMQELSGTAVQIEALLGNGFFNVQGRERYTKLQTSFGAPQLLLQLVVTYADGSTRTIKTDKSWQWRLSPVTFNSIYGGESYDARLTQQARHDVVICEGARGKLVPQTAPPVKIMESFPVKSISHIHPDSIAAAEKQTKRSIARGAFVCDMGQNLAGFPQITVKGKKGQKVTLVVAEKLNQQGACNQRESGRQHFYEYTIGQDGRQETWHPRFSYYGYRYIQVEGAVLQGMDNPDNLPVITDLQSLFVYNSAKEISAFECSNDLFTQTHRLIERAERSNMQSVLTDCPHREKLGWLEQDHLCGPSLLYNYDMTAYVPKVIRDITDTQRNDGMVATIAPQYVSFGNLFDDSPEWGAALIIMPFQYYEMYGDNSLIKDNYTAMARYADYLTSRSQDGIVSHGLGDWYDFDPEKPSGFSHNTPIPLVATCHYIYCLQLMQRAAQMTGNTTDEKRYADRLQYVVTEFNNRFYRPDSLSYASGSQAANALPLFLGITGDRHDAVLQSLLNDIAAHGNRLTTGDVGNRYLFRTLADTGNNELLYTMLNHDETPGYGFQLKYGATTLTEQWDPRNGTSWNHFMMGQIDEWLFRTLAGIRQQDGSVGMRHLLISPTLVGDLQYVRAKTQSLYGEISVDCSRTEITVSIPVGCDATIQLPNGKTKSVGSGKHRIVFSD